MPVFAYKEQADNLLLPGIDLHDQRTRIKPRSSQPWLAVIPKLAYIRPL